MKTNPKAPDRTINFFRSPDFPFSPSRIPFFYGWVVLAATVVGIVMSIPGQTMGVGVFTDFLITTTGLDRLTLSTAYMFGTIASSLVLPFSGKLLDTWGSRFVIVLASSGLGLSLVMLGHIESLIRGVGSLMSIVNKSIISFVVMLVVFALIRQFGQGLMALSSRTMLSKWFDRKRGLTTGISGVFISFGFSGSPLFLNWMIQRSDWQTTCFQLAVITGVIMTVFGWIFFRDNPEACGLVMDGKETINVESENTVHVQEAEIEVPVNRVRRSYTFWIFNIGLGLQALIVTALTFHIASLGEVSGLERSQVFALFLPMSVVSVFTNLTAGWLSDRMQLKRLLMTMMVAMFIGTVSMLFLDSLAGKIAMALGFGMSGGLFGCLAAVTWPRYFGRKNLGAISGMNMATMVFASAIGPPLFGLSQSLTTGYGLAVWISAALPIIVLLCSFGVKRHR
ncbi:MAG: MFS transporter [Proteobacteria bacterium]|nr:MFS transporter [Pseudomonadota bacterium]